MKSKKNHRPLAIFLLLCFSYSLNAQVRPGDYKATVEKEGSKIQYELKIDPAYLVITAYETNPAKFIKTVGGFYTYSNKSLKVHLEFNSDFDKDGRKELTIPFTLEQEKLVLFFGDPMQFIAMPEMRQDLDGRWLFATRGPDTGQVRRGDENPRKTLKFLIDGHFQWIAYNTATMQFSGTGGGTYTAKDGVYTEHISYFSRDNSLVGASLQFKYKLNGADWLHTGMNSKGEPLYEIWARRR